MKAVIWTDVFQAMVMFGGMLAIVVQVSPYSKYNTINTVQTFISIRKVYFSDESQIFQLLFIC